MVLPFICHVTQFFQLIWTGFVSFFKKLLFLTEWKYNCLKCLLQEVNSRQWKPSSGQVSWPLSALGQGQKMTLHSYGPDQPTPSSHAHSWGPKSPLSSPPCVLRSYWVLNKGSLKTPNKQKTPPKLFHTILSFPHYSSMYCWNHSSWHLVTRYLLLLSLRS